MRFDEIDGIDELTPSVGFNVVGRNGRNPKRYVVGHFDDREVAERSRAEHEERSGNETVIFDPRYTAENFEGELRFHAAKLDSHIARSLLALRLGESAANFGLPHKHAALITRAIGTTEDQEHRVIEALRRSMFLDLKVNFEMFIWTCIRAWLRRDLRGALARVEQGAKGRLKGFVTNAKAADPSKPDWEQQIPAHGLDTLSLLLSSASGVQVESTPAWSQIAVAFAVRHVVEHRNGRVDKPFANDVAKHWSSSSWGSRLPGLPPRVDIQASDFDATFGAMSGAAVHLAEAVCAAWHDRSCVPKYEPLPDAPIGDDWSCSATRRPRPTKFGRIQCSRRCSHASKHIPMVSSSSNVSAQSMTSSIASDSLRAHTRRSSSCVGPR